MAKKETLLKHAKLVYDRIKNDPERWKARQEYMKKRREALKADPIKYAEWKEKHREYERKRYQKKRVDTIKIEELIDEAQELIDDEISLEPLEVNSEN